MIRDSGKWLHSIDPKVVNALRGRSVSKDQCSRNLRVDVVSPIARDHHYSDYRNVDKGLVMSVSNSHDRHYIDAHPYSHNMSVGVHNHEEGKLLSAEAKVSYYTNLMNNELNPPSDVSRQVYSGHRGNTSGIERRNNAETQKVRRRHFTSSYSDNSPRHEAEGRNVINNGTRITISSKITPTLTSALSSPRTAEVNAKKRENFYRQKILKSMYEDRRANKGDKFDPRGLLDPRVYDDDYEELISWKQTDTPGRVSKSGNRWNSRERSSAINLAQRQSGAVTSPKRYPGSSSATKAARRTKPLVPYSLIRPVSPPPVLYPAVASARAPLVATRGAVGNDTTSTVIVVPPTETSAKITCRYNSERSEKRAVEHARKLAEERQYISDHSKDIILMSLVEDEGFERDSLVLTEVRQFSFIKQYEIDNFEEQCAKARLRCRMWFQEDEADDRASLQIREEDNRKRITDYRRSVTLSLQPFNHLYIKEAHERFSFEILEDRCIKEIMKEEKMEHLEIASVENEMMRAARLSQQERVSDTAGTLMELLSSQRERAAVSSPLRTRSKEDNIVSLSDLVSITHESGDSTINVGVSHLLSSPTPECVKNVVSSQKETPVSQRIELTEKELHFISPSVTPESRQNTSLYSSLIHTDTVNGNKRQICDMSGQMTSHKRNVHRKARGDSKERPRVKDQSIESNIVTVAQPERIRRNNAEKTLIGQESRHHSFRYGSTKEFQSSSLGGQSPSNENSITSISKISKSSDKYSPINSHTKALRKTSSSGFSDRCRPSLPSAVILPKEGDGSPSSLSLSLPQPIELEYGGTTSTKVCFSPNNLEKRELSKNRDKIMLMEDPRVGGNVSDVELAAMENYSENETTFEATCIHSNKAPLTEDPRVKDSVSLYSETTFNTAPNPPLRKVCSHLNESTTFNTSLEVSRSSPTVRHHHNNRPLPPDKCSSRIDITVNTKTAKSENVNSKNVNSKKNSYERVSSKGPSTLVRRTCTSTATHREQSPSIKYHQKCRQTRQQSSKDMQPSKGQLHDYGPMMPYHTSSFYDSRRHRTTSRYAEAVCTIADKHRSDPQNFARTLKSKFGRTGSTYREDMADAMHSAVTETHQMEIKVSSMRQQRQRKHNKLYHNINRSCDTSPTTTGYLKYVIGGMPLRPPDDKDGVTCTTTAIFPSPYKLDASPLLDKTQ